VMHWALWAVRSPDLLRRGGARSWPAEATNCGRSMDGNVQGAIFSSLQEYASAYPAPMRRPIARRVGGFWHRWNAALAAGISAGGGGWLLGLAAPYALPIWPFVCRFVASVPPGHPAGFDKRAWAWAPLQHWLEVFLASEASRGDGASKLRGAPRFLYTGALGR